MEITKNYSKIKKDLVLWLQRLTVPNKKNRIPVRVQLLSDNSYRFYYGDVDDDEDYEGDWAFGSIKQSKTIEQLADELIKDLILSVNYIDEYINEFDYE